jgi:osomolarity two-component system response regulator SSK1
MQALIDFDGWRKWKDISQTTENADEGTKKVAAKKKKANRSSIGSAPGTASSATREGKSTIREEVELQVGA